MVQLESGKYYKTRDGRKVGPMIYSRYKWKDTMHVELDPPVNGYYYTYWDMNGRHEEEPGLDIVE